MSRAKKVKFTAFSFLKSSDFRTFLKNSGLEADNQRISQLEIIPGIYVNFNDYIEYDISSYLQNTGLYDLFPIDHK